MIDNQIVITLKVNPTFRDRRLMEKVREKQKELVRQSQKPNANLGEGLAKETS